MKLKCSFCNQIGGALIPTNLTLADLSELKEKGIYEEKMIKNFFKEHQQNTTDSSFTQIMTNEVKYTKLDN